MREFINSRKSVRWSAVPVPCLSRLCLKLRGKQGSGPKGVDDLCFHTYGELSPPSTRPSVCPSPPVSRPKPQSQDPNPSLVAQILASRPKSYPGGLNSSQDAQISSLILGYGPPGWGFGPQGFDLGLQTRIWASRLGFGP